MIISNTSFSSSFINHYQHPWHPLELSIASISKVSKRPKINIIPPKQLFVNLTQADTKTPSPNGYLYSPSSPPSRVSPPPPTQENASMDTTLTLSSITLLDVQFDTPSPSPPIIKHPIPWNLLEAH
ncbi:hypothetical protein Tco_1411612, partial [Tanacetum coccineum]